MKKMVIEGHEHYFHDIINDEEEQVGFDPYHPLLTNALTPENSPNNVLTNRTTADLFKRCLYKIKGSESKMQNHKRIKSIRIVAENEHCATFLRTENFGSAAEMSSVLVLQ